MKDSLSSLKDCDGQRVDAARASCSIAAQSCSAISAAGASQEPPTQPTLGNAS